MKFDKERLKKIHGITELIKHADPSVLARRKLHETAARWCEKWLVSLHFFFVFIGFTFIFLPAIATSWRIIVINIPIFSNIYHNYSTLSGFAMINFFIIAILAVAKNNLIKHIPGGAISVLPYRDVIRMELYPRSRLEELAYWSDISFALASTTISLFLPFGVIAFFISRGV